VNALNTLLFFIAKRERGIGESKRKWGIEMNDARYLYLKTYGGIDNIDAMLKKCHIAYRSRKYWHSAMNHMLAFTIVVAYNMYVECTSGSLAPEWNLPKKGHDISSVPRQIV